MGREKADLNKTGLRLAVTVIAPLRTRVVYNYADLKKHGQKGELDRPTMPAEGRERKPLQGSARACHLAGLQQWEQNEDWAGNESA